MTSVPSEIWNYFTKHHIPHQFVCKYCSTVMALSNGSVNSLYQHVFMHHRQKVIQYSEQQRKEMKAKKEKYNEEQDEYMSDEWLDRLALDGYPIQEIISSILMRYKEDSISFGRYLAKRSAALKNSKYKVKSFLPQIPLNTLPEDIVPYLVDKYRISEEGSRLLIKDYFWCNQDDDEMFYELQKRGIIIKHFEEDRMNKVIFVCTEYMRKNYFRFGDAVNLEFKMVKIQNCDEFHSKEYLVGYFMGQDTNILPTIFGILIISQNRQELFRIGFEQFVEAMRKRIPCCLIINQNRQCLKAVQKLSKKYEFSYMINWYYISNKLTKNISQSIPSSQIHTISALFQKTLVSIHPFQFQKSIQQLKEMLGIENQIIRDFEENAHLYCLSKKKPSFIGFGIQIERIKTIHYIIEMELTGITNLGMILLKSIRMEQKLMKRLEKGYIMMDQSEMNQIMQQKIRMQSDFNFLRRRMEKLAFQKLISNYQIAKKSIKIVEEKENLCKVSYEKSDIVYYVKYFPEQDCWKCNCWLIVWSGLPCCHLIKVLLRYGGLISYYLSQRWYICSRKFNPQRIQCEEEINLISEIQ